MDTLDPLSYFLSEKGKILVVNLVGPLSHGNSDVLEACHNDIAKSGARFVILGMKGVAESMDRTLVPKLARMQKMIREKPASLRIASVHPELHGFLSKQGLLRHEEVSKSLQEALVSLYGMLSKAA